MEGNNGESAGDQLKDDGRHHVRQGEDAQHEEVEGEKEVDVFFTEHLQIMILILNW